MVDQSLDNPGQAATQIDPASSSLGSAGGSGGQLKKSSLKDRAKKLKIGLKIDTAEIGVK